MSDESTPSAETTDGALLPEASAEGQEGGQEATGEEGEPAAPPKRKRTADELMSAAIGKKQRVNRERKALAAERETFARERAHATERLSRADRIEAALARAKEDPEALSEFGIDYDAWTTKRLREGTPDAKIELLEKKLDAEAALREKRERFEREREEAEHNERAENAFVALTRSGAYPETELYKDGVIKQMGETVGQELGRKLGRPARHAEIAAEVERQLAEIEADKAAMRTARDAKAKPGSPTLTNRTGAESTGKRRELSKDEQEKDIASTLGSWFTGA